MNKKKYLFSLMVFLLIAAVLLILIISKKESLSGRAKGLNLMIITLDTVRADRLGAYGCGTAGTPNIDKLAEQGIVFENCYTPVPLTLPAHCSLFTGRYPLAHGVRDNGSYYLNDRESTLAEKMKSLGYQTFAAIAAFVLQTKFNVNQGFDFFDDSLKIDQMINDFSSEIKADRIYAKFRHWFKSRDREKNFFAWLHFYDPHLPYDPPQEFRKFGDNELALYDGEIAYVDHYLGEVMADLISENLLARTLLVIVGDHGEDLGEHEEFGHGIFCYEESLRVPLIFHCPYIFPDHLRIKSQVNLIDIMPTILDLYGEKISPGIQGKSFTDLFSGNKEKSDRTFYIESMYGQENYGWAPLTGIMKNNYKYISLPEAELYDLDMDKQEKNNLFFKMNRLAKKMDKELAGLVKEISQADINSRRELSQTDKQHLQSLGYISAFSEKTEGNVDPKHWVGIRKKYHDIERKIESGDLNEAEKQLKKLVGENPENMHPKYFGLLRKIYQQRNDYENAVLNWQQAIKRYPDNDNFKINLAFEFFHLDKLEESDKLADAIIKHNNRYARAYILKGKIAEKRNHPASAENYYKRALELEPANFSLRIGFAKLLSQTKKFSRAGKICGKLLKIEEIRQNVGLLSRIGIVLTEIGRDELAFEVLNQAKALDDTKAEVWNYLGILFYRKKEYDKSLSAYQKSLELDDELAKTHNNLGTLYLTLFLNQRDSQLHARALAAFNKALKIDPELVSALNGRASAYKFANRISLALNDWKKALTIKPDFIDAYFNIGITYLQLKENVRALKYFQICKDKFSDQLSSRDKDRLDRLISQARG